MSPEKRYTGLSRLVRTEVLSMGPTYMALRLRIDRESHRLELVAREGKLCGLRDRVEVALEVWFPGLWEIWPDRAWLCSSVASIIRERHEHELPGRPDPRRLPLTLPAFGPKTEAAWSRGPRRAKVLVEA